jgi:hypothetical protein
VTPTTQRHHDDYAARNLFAFALLGLTAEARRVRELTRRIIARAPRGGRARTPHALEFALLGAVSFGLALDHRLRQLGREVEPAPAPPSGTPESCPRTLLV